MESAVKNLGSAKDFTPEHRAEAEEIRLRFAEVRERLDKHENDPKLTKVRYSAQNPNAPQGAPQTQPAPTINDGVARPTPQPGPGEAPQTQTEAPQPTQPTQPMDPRQQRREAVEQLFKGLILGQ